MRYKGIKGRFWKVFSDYVRLRDSQRYGTCITCGQRKEYTEIQAGHYVPAGNCGFSLLFDEDNVHGECNYDNAFNKFHLVEYRKNLVKRIGTLAVERIDERYRDSHYRGRTMKEWSKKEYETKILEYKEKIKCLTHST